MTDTLLLPKFVTYAKAPSGDMATPKGVSPTGMVVSTVFVARSMTLTLSRVEFGTYANGAASAGVAVSETDSVRSVRRRRIIGHPIRRRMARSEDATAATGPARPEARWSTE